MLHPLPKTFSKPQHLGQGRQGLKPRKAQLAWPAEGERGGGAALTGRAPGPPRRRPRAASPGPSCRGAPGERAASAQALEGLTGVTEL